MTFDFVDVISLICLISVFLCIHHKVFYLSWSTATSLLTKYLLRIK